MKCCLHCECLAEFSLCMIVSTLGVSNRRQRCTTALPFCASCLQRLLREDEVSTSAYLRRALSEAYRALTQHSVDPTELRAEAKPSRKRGRGSGWEGFGNP